jgi:hypothetical protein
MDAPAWLDELNLESPVAMGTRSLTGDLFLGDEDFERDLRWKATLLAERHDEVFAALDSPAVRAASEEVLGLVGGDASGLHPLDAAGRRVQEDLCILVLRDGAPHLDAASLCFPSYWRLADKLGHPLADVHGPVPHYARELAGKVDGFLRRLQPGRMVWRRNWSIHDDPTYFLPEPGPAGDALYLRSERQVLRRLDTPDTVLFTIRTQQVPLAVVAQRPDIARRMAESIAGWSPELVAYKGGKAAARGAEWLATLNL